MTRGDRLHVIDPGTHLLKGVTVEVAADGGIRVREASATPVPLFPVSPEEHLTLIAEPLKILAARHFRKGSSVIVVGGEELVRAGLRRVVCAADVALSQSVDHSRRQFVELHGVRERTFASSVLVRRERRGPGEQLLLAHSFVRLTDLERVVRWLAAADLSLSGLYPRLLALEEACATRAEELYPGGTVLVTSQ